MWNRLVDWLVYAPRRRVDMQILWPACREQAPDLDHAKAAFAAHAFNDKAWRVLGEAQLARMLRSLA